MSRVEMATNERKKKKKKMCIPIPQIGRAFFPGCGDLGSQLSQILDRVKIQSFLFQLSLLELLKLLFCNTASISWSLANEQLQEKQPKFQWLQHSPAVEQMWALYSQGCLTYPGDSGRPRVCPISSFQGGTTEVLKQL